MANKTPATKTPAAKKTSKKTSKKATKKTPVTATTAAATAPTRPAKASTPSTEEKLRALETLINKPGKRPILQRAASTESSYLLRRPTGITSLDIALAGGLPASAPVMLTGPDGAGKDYLLLRTCAEVQQIYGEDFAMVIYLTEFKFDKAFARDMCGLKVAMTPTELDEFDLARSNAGQPPLSPEDRARYSEQVGNIYIIDDVPAEHGFDVIIDCIASNAFQIACVNSVGFLQTLAKEDTDSYEEFPQQRNEAILLSKFMPDLALTLNRGGPSGERNETCVILIDQVRSSDAPVRRGKIPAQAKDKYRPAREVWALKHGLAISVQLHKGPNLWNEAKTYKVGRTTSWELLKGKLGTHEGLRGEYNFFYEGGADTHGDLAATAENLGVLAKAGSWYSFDDPSADLSFRAAGLSGVRKAIAFNPLLRDRLRYLCFQKAGVVYRHR